MNDREPMDEKEKNAERWKAFDESPNRRGSKDPEELERWAAWDESPARRGYKRKL